MKADKDNPKHIVLLLLSGIIILAALPFRLLRNKNKKTVVFFYQMHGNVKALADYIEQHDTSIRMYFLAFPEYLKIYEGKHDLQSLSMLSLKDMITVVQSDCVVTNYQPLTLVYLAKLTNIKFIDVWHGISMLKNETAKMQRYLNDYAEVWVSSPAMRRFYKTRYKLTSKVVATGYGRVDSLVNGTYKDVKKRYAIPNKKVIMIAPTWKQRDENRSVLPFGMNEKELIPYLKTLAKATNTFIIFRAHMLSGAGLRTKDEQYIRSMPTQVYPDTEELLSITDILVTDWSSLVFDFFVLDRPVIFIDTTAPFQGEDLQRRSSPENRFGELVKDSDQFDKAVTTYLKDPGVYLQKHKTSIKAAKEKAYGGLADGKATERYYQRLQRLLTP